MIEIILFLWCVILTILMIIIIYCQNNQSDLLQYLLVKEVSKEKIIHATKLEKE